MAAEIVQAMYEELAQIASRFGAQAEEISALKALVERAYAPLEGGDWQGDAAVAFGAEMTEELFPATDRLINALREGQAVTSQIAEKMRQAEEEAEAIWRDWRLDGGGGGGGDGGGGGGGGIGFMDVVHGVLDVAGFVPGLGAVPDLINAGIYAAEGDWANAAMSGAAAIPIAGDALKAADKVRDVAKMVDKVDDAADAAKAVDKIDDAADAAKVATEVTPAIRNQIKNLPKDPQDLVRNGWKDVTDPRAAANSPSREFLDPQTGMRVRFDPGKPGANGFEGVDHYHVYNPAATGKGDRYLDINGNPVTKGSKPSHIEP